MLLELNNGITINFGHGYFYGGGTDQSPFSFVLPKANTKFTMGCINADVGGSGWPYLNGISCQSCTITNIGGRYCLGVVTKTPYSWIAIGY